MQLNLFLRVDKSAEFNYLWVAWENLTSSTFGEI